MHPAASRPATNSWHALPEGRVEDWRAAADEHMQFIAANRYRVRSYFQDPIVKYAA
jgi:hypothetical protein